MGQPGDQGAVIAFLAESANHGGAAVERVETHVSHVFLAGERAYKLKKAIKLPYLDFSTLERRRAACEAEIALNRRTAPSIYRAAEPVVRRSDGSLAIGGEGTAEDWVVRMRRFDEETVFDRLAAAGTLRRRLLDTLAEEIARFHDGAEPRPDHGGVGGLRAVVDNDAAVFAEAGPGILDMAAVARMADGQRRAIDTLAEVLEARRSGGRVRHCHGDLHLRNICLVDGAPTLFDCIEFSDPIACIDTLYDLAFLVMDLDQRGLRREASIVLNRYIAVSGDVGAIGALPAMLSLRAAIRCHVAATQAGQHAGQPNADKAAEAVGYLRAALDYLDPPAPRLVASGGLSGSGKSRLARELAPFLGAAPGAVVLRTDSIRKRLMGVGQLDRLGPDAYTEEVTRRVYDTMFADAEAVLGAGHAVVLDAVFAREDERARAEAVARDAGVAFDGLWLEAPAETMAARIDKRRDNPSDATVAVLEQQLSYDLGALDWTRVDSSGPKDVTLAAARKAVGA